MEYFKSTERMHRNTIGILVFLLVVAIFFLSAIPYGSKYVWYESVFCALIFVTGALTLIFRFSTLDFSLLKVALPVLLLAVYSALQAGFGLIQLQSGPFGFLPNTYDVAGSFWSSIKIVSVAVYLMALGTCFKSNVRPLAWTLLLAGNVLVLTGLVRYVAQSAAPNVFPTFLFDSLKPGVGFGTMLNQNHFALLVLMVLPLNLALLLLPRISIRLRLLLILGAGSSWITLILTGSRAGIIGSFVVIAALFGGISRQSFVLGKYKIPLFARIAGFAVLFAVLAAGVIFVGQDRVLHRFKQLPAQLEQSELKPAFSRIDTYAATARIIADQPVFGVGFGSFRFAVTQYLDVSGLKVPEQAHNDYLELVAIGGVFAAAIFLWLLFLVFRLYLRRSANSERGFTKAARTGALCAILGVAFHSLFDFGLQIYSNLLFFVPVVFLLIHKEKPEIPSDKYAKSAVIRGAMAFAGGICLLLAAASFLFGVSRYSIEETGSLAGVTRFPRFPFDAEAYVSDAQLEAGSGNIEAAISASKKAIALRSHDYRIWLDLGKLWELKGREKEALNAFVKSSELAPYFAEPRYRMGIVLNKLGRKDEAFRALKTAYRQNPAYFYKTAELAWAESDGNSGQVIKRLAPFSAAETVMMGLFFYERDLFPAIVKLTCNNKSANEGMRNSFVIRLIEKRRYWLAHQVKTRRCEKGPVKPYVEDAGFESAEIMEGIGFGWRVPDLPQTIKVGTSQPKDREGSSLKVDFSGHSNPDLRIVSQIILLEPNREYVVGFDYSVVGLVTSGSPVVNFITRGPDRDGTFAKMELETDKAGWQSSEATIKTGNEIEALEIQLVRRPCSGELCPAYGTIFLDNFRIRLVR